MPANGGTEASQPGGRVPKSAEDIVARRVAALDELRSLNSLQRAQLQDAHAALAGRPPPSVCERVRHMVRALDPEEALLWHLCEGLELADQLRMTGLRPGARNRLVACLDRITVIVGRELPLARPSGDSATDTQFHRRLREVADSFRSLKIEVLLPNPEGINRVMAALIQALHAMAGDNWHLMPGDAAPSPPAPPAAAAP